MKGVTTPPTTYDLNINTIDAKLSTTMWPPVMLANKRIIKANALETVPKSSIGARINLTRTGTPGIQNICFQYALFALTCTIKNVSNESVKVNAILPDRLEPPGKKGIKPIKLLIQIKKNSVSK